MKLHNPHSPERILFYGMEGTGKTYSMFKIAQALGGKLYCIDTDFSSIRTCAEFPDVETEIVHPEGWGDYIAALNDFSRSAGLTDVVGVDMVGPAWEAAQEHFTDRVFGKDLENYFLETKKMKMEENKKGNIFDGTKDWPIINKIYFKFPNKIMRLNAKTNIVLVAAATELISDLESTEIISTYNGVGLKPKGQKHIGHLAHTVVYCSRNSKNKEFRMTTVKDRGRELISNQPINDFAIDYLLNVAGWEVSND